MDRVAFCSKSDEVTLVVTSTSGEAVEVTQDQIIAAMRATGESLPQVSKFLRGIMTAVQDEIGKRLYV